MLAGCEEENEGLTEEGHFCPDEKGVCAVGEGVDVTRF